MKRTSFFVVAFVTLALAGCASAPGPNCVRLSARGFFCLLAPAALAPQSGTDLVTVTRRGKAEHYVGQLSITPARVELALTSLAGLSFATVSWNGSTAKIRAPKEMRLDPGQLVALLELTLASPDALRGALHNLELSLADTAAGRERRLSASGKLVARAVSAGDGTTRVEVPRAALVLALRPLASDGQ
ncbi:MAG: DUF3261 domain-containing protein [Gammaproteobacteria bacterium]